MPEHERTRVSSPRPFTNSVEERILLLERKYHEVKGDILRSESNSNKWQKWIWSLVPTVGIAIVMLILAYGKQQELEKDAEIDQEKMIQVETRMGAIESDVKVIKVEQQYSRKSLETVSQTLKEMKESQERVEDRLYPRRRQ